MSKPPSLKSCAELERIPVAYSLDRMLLGYSPLMKYMPTDQLLFKMMKAGIGCESIDDTWVY